MENKTKALDIAMSLIDCELPTLEKCRKSAIQMAEWKDRQFAEEKKQWIDKACEWLNEHSGGYWMDDYDLPTDELVNDFKKAMKGE